MCTFVFPNWSRYLRNSNTCAPLHLDRDSGGLWFLKYCPKVFQSLRFWFSYLLGDGEEGGDVADGVVAVVVDDDDDDMVLMMLLLALFDGEESNS